MERNYGHKRATVSRHARRSSPGYLIRREQAPTRIARHTTNHHLDHYGPRMPSPALIRSLVYRAPMTAVGSVTRLQVVRKLFRLLEMDWLGTNPLHQHRALSQSLSEQSAQIGGEGYCRSFVIDHTILTSHAGRSRVWCKKNGPRGGNPSSYCEQ